MNVTVKRAIKVLKGYGDDRLIDDNFTYELSQAHKAVADKVLGCELFDDYQNLNVLTDTVYTPQEAKKYTDALPEGVEILLDDVYNDPNQMKLMTVGDLVEFIETQPFL